MGIFTIMYEGINDDNEKELVICRFDGVSNIEETFTIAPSETMWSINFENIVLTLEELQAIPDATIIKFNTFRTNAGSKDNIIENGVYQNFIR